MRAPALAVFAAAVLAAGCEAEPPTTPPAPTPETSGQASVLPIIKPQPPTGWIEADGPGEVALEWRAVENTPGFMISCSNEGVLRVSLPDPSNPPTANGAAGRLAIGALEAPVEVLSGDVGGPHIDAETPVTPELLAALRQAREVALLLTGAEARTGADQEGRLAGLAEGCAALAGLAAPL